MNAEIRSVIADDELLALQKLRILLAQEAGIRVVGECRDGRKQAHRIKLSFSATKR